MTVHYAPRTKHADTRIAWADSLPETWQDITLRWGASIFAGGTPSKSNSGFWENGSIPWLNSGSVNQGLIKRASAFITEAALKQSSARWIKRGSLVIALAGQGKTKGTVAQLDIDATCNQSMAAIVPTSKLRPRFLLWWLSSNYQNIRNMAGGDLRDGLNLQLLGDIQCPLPSLPEQTQIAKFLDHETAKIDALIQKQQQLIALLKEKREAVISHAVTKGLNPGAPMRDSGVEWLGEVPAHWETWKLAHAFREIGSGTTPPSDEEFWYGGEIPWITTGELRESEIRSTYKTVSTKTIAQFSGLKIHPAGAVAIAMYGATIGRLGILATPACTNQACCVLSGSNTVLEKFLFYWFQAVRADIISLSFGGGQANISQGIIAALRISVPSVPEQTEIVLHLEAEMERFAELSATAEEAVELLQERRTALISAAVTGKIDVRNWSPDPAPAEAEVA